MDHSNLFEREELEKFVSSLSSYSPALPDSLVQHHLARAGFQTDDLNTQRLIAVAAQKFVADIANDAISHSRLRQSSTPAPKKASSARERVVLSVDDLELALREYGVVLKKPPYFADHVSAGAAGAKDDPVTPLKPKP